MQSQQLGQPPGPGINSDAADGFGDRLNQALQNGALRYDEGMLITQSFSTDGAFTLYLAVITISMPVKTTNISINMSAEFR